MSEIYECYDHGTCRYADKIEELTAERDVLKARIGAKEDALDSYAQLVDVIAQVLGLGDSLPSQSFDNAVLGAIIKGIQARAEVELLKSKLDQAVLGLITPELAACREERDAARAEVERLTFELDATHKFASGLCEEVERLREALALGMSVVRPYVLEGCECEEHAALDNFIAAANKALEVKE